MIDDIAESIIKTIFRFILEILILVVFFYTGEIVLFTLTCGKRTPRWDNYEDASLSKWVVFTEISIWIGIAFWIFIVWLINSFFFS